jgi:hypothetical protein
MNKFKFSKKILLCGGSGFLILLSVLFVSCKLFDAKNAVNEKYTSKIYRLPFTGEAKIISNDTVNNSIDFRINNGHGNSLIIVSRSGRICGINNRDASIAGKRIEIVHSDGDTSIYSHLGNFYGNLKVGDKVTIGDTIGFQGEIGKDTNAYLRFSIKSKMKSSDVRKILGVDWLMKSATYPALFVIKSNHSKKVIDVPSGSDKEGCELIQWGYNGGSNQLWLLESVGEYYTITSNFTWKCIAVKETGNKYIIVQEGSQINREEQLWKVEVNDGSYKIISAFNNFVLKPENGSHEEGARITVDDTTGNINPFWTLTHFNFKSYYKDKLGKVSYTLVQAPSPTKEQQKAYILIKKAMDSAVWYVNKYNNYFKKLTVHYELSARADGNFNGNIRFGSDFYYINTGTAIHEISHTLGVGTSPVWMTKRKYIKDYKNAVYTGEKATNMLRKLTGDSTAVIFMDNKHFWPYGLNYVHEYKSATDLIFHCMIVQAMKEDGI